MTVKKTQARKNRADMHKYGPWVMSTFEKEVKKIKPEHFVQFSAIVDRLPKDKLVLPNSPNQEENNNKPKEQYLFDENLKAIGVRFGHKEYSNFLKEIIAKSPEGSYARQAATHELESLPTPSIESVSEEERNAVKDEMAAKNNNESSNDYSRTINKPNRSKNPNAQESENENLGPSL